MSISEIETLYLVSCVSRKKSGPAAAKDLYVSDWFRKARDYVESRKGTWRILSAEYGLLNPETTVEPYEQTLNRMGVVARKDWAARVLNDLLPQLSGVDRVVILAGQRYREFLVNEIESQVASIEIPLKGLKIGQQLAWFKSSNGAFSLSDPDRLSDLKRFYHAMDSLEVKLEGFRTLAACSAKNNWPRRGVYFFFEESEKRSDSGKGPRIVRVGTHGLKAGSRASLWSRLSQHRGGAIGCGGNHRGSIFRLLLGQALASRDQLLVPSWGVGSSGSAAAIRLSIGVEAIKSSEQPLEQLVTKTIGGMPFLFLEVDDEPGPTSLRGYIERNTISLLSNFNLEPFDAPSSGWLGKHSNRERVRGSGLWNNNHVDEKYDPAFLLKLEKLIAMI